MALTDSGIRSVLSGFRLEGTCQGIKEMHSGNVHATYHLIYGPESENRDYILQRVNTYAFREPQKMMENIVGITNHLRSRITGQGQDPRRRVLEVIPARNGDLLYADPDGGCWRVYRFIAGASAYDTTDPEKFYQVGRGFGRFQKLLIDYPADSLYESIPYFHNTRRRFDQLIKAIDEDTAGRVGQTKNEIDFIFDRRKMLFRIVDLIENGTLPLRVTHNDTKSNNVMLDQSTGEALCVIDLDTVMPGSVLYDYGDAIRFGANRAKEDEADTSLIGLDMDKARAFTKGFTEETNGFLTREELALLPLGISVMTGELIIRFLTDYLMGDPYFRIDYPEHNLVRARAQAALLRDIENRENELQQMVNGLLR